METIAEKLRSLLEAASSSPGILEYSILALGALLEYVFPPFPGDVVVLLGAFLVGRYGWSLPVVFLVVGIGSAVGLSLDYAFGVWVRKRDPAWRVKHRWWARLGTSIDRFDVFYRRWGPLCIAANRFVPAVRAIFFVGAGMAGVRYVIVLVLGLLSAALWNVLLLAVGVSVGHNWERLKTFLRSYTTVAWIVGAVVLVAIAMGVAIRRRQKLGGPRNDPPDR
jgi:membrane-associated protein